MKYRNSIIYHYPYPRSVEFSKALKMTCAGFVISSISQALFGPFFPGCFCTPWYFFSQSKKAIWSCFDSICKWPVSVGSLPLYWGYWGHQSTWHTLLHPSFTYLTYMYVWMTFVFFFLIWTFVCGAIFVFEFDIYCYYLSLGNQHMDMSLLKSEYILVSDCLSYIDVCY